MDADGRDGGGDGVREWRGRWDPLFRSSPFPLRLLYVTFSRTVIASVHLIVVFLCFSNGLPATQEVAEIHAVFRVGKIVAVVLVDFVVTIWLCTLVDAVKCHVVPPSVLPIMGHYEVILSACRSGCQGSSGCLMNLTGNGMRWGESGMGSGQQRFACGFSDRGRFRLRLNQS